MNNGTFNYGSRQDATDWRIDEMSQCRRFLSRRCFDGCLKVDRLSHPLAVPENTCLEGHSALVMASHVGDCRTGWMRKRVWRMKFPALSEAESWAMRDIASCTEEVRSQSLCEPRLHLMARKKIYVCGLRDL